MVTNADISSVNWITTLLAVISALISIVSAVFVRRQFKADHERTRRIQTIEALKWWISQLEQRASLCRKFAEKLEPEQVWHLVHERKVILNNELKAAVVSCLSEENADIKENGDDQIELSVAQSSEIRWQIVKFLNMLEAVLFGWHQSILDRESIENQFSYLVTKDGSPFLEEFRRCLGGSKSYPAIAKFIEILRERGASKINQKSKIG